MTDPRMHDTRISIALRLSGSRGTTEKHRLMTRAGEAIRDVESLLVMVEIDLSRGDHDAVRLRLKHIALALGRGNVVSDCVNTDEYQHVEKRDIATDGN